MSVELIGILAILILVAYVYIGQWARKKAHEGFFYGNYDKAINLYTWLIRFHPWDAWLFYRRGICLEGQEKHAEAIADFSRAIRRKRYYFDAYMAREDAYRKSGEAGKADADIEQIKAMLLLPDSVLNISMEIRFRAYEHVGNHQQALALASQAIETQQSYLEKMQSHGAYLPQKQEMTNEMLRLYLMRAGIYKELEDYPNVLADVEKAIAVQPTSFFPYVHRADIYQLLGRYSEAIPDYEMAIRHEPRFEYVYQARIGDLYFSLGDLDQALKAYNDSVKLNTDDKYSVAGQAVAYHALGQVEQAQLLWQRLIEKDARYTDIDWVKEHLHWHDPTTAEARKIIELLNVSTT